MIKIDFGNTQCQILVPGFDSTTVDIFLMLKEQRIKTPAQWGYGKPLAAEAADENTTRWRMATGAVLCLFLNSGPMGLVNKVQAEIQCPGRCIPNTRFFREYCGRQTKSAPIGTRYVLGIRSKRSQPPVKTSKPTMNHTSAIVTRSKDTWFWAGGSSC